jgi:HAD superfamily hydrolase (TIGR01509 family)
VSAAPPLAVEAVSFDFGNTLVRVDRAGLRAVIHRTADELLERGTITDAPAFLSAWSEERDRQFRDEVPQLREVDMSQRVVRVLARLRGFGPPAADDAWDDLEAARFVDPLEAEFAIETYSAAFVATMVAMPDASAVIAGLAARGFRLVIVSNWPYAATIDRFADAEGWTPYLEAVIVSQRVGTIKPHPEIFRQAAAAVVAPPDRILHVGDDWAADVVGAARAGWKVAYVRNRQADTSLPTSMPGADVVPDLVIDELAEIGPRIDRWTP